MSSCRLAGERQRLEGCERDSQQANSQETQTGKGRQTEKGSANLGHSENRREIQVKSEKKAVADEKDKGLGGHECEIQERGRHH